MERNSSRCNWCGAHISDTDRNCPTCGKAIARKLVRKDYSGVLQQQGTVVADDDWNEGSRIRTKGQRIASVRYSSCGAINSAKNKHCKNCESNL